MIRKLFLITLLCSLFLVGCSEETSKTETNGIRKEMYDEALTYYNLMNERLDNKQELSDEEKKKIDEFIKKHDLLLKELNKNERLLLANLGSMRLLLDLIPVSVLINDTKGLKKEIDDYVKAQVEVSKVLGIEFK